MSLAFRNSPHHALPANIPRKSLQTPPTAGKPSVPPSLPRVLPRPARPAPDDANVAPQAEASDNPAAPALRFHVPRDSRPALPPRHSESQPRRSSLSMPLALANSSPRGTPPAPARIFPTRTPVRARADSSSPAAAQSCPLLAAALSVIRPIHRLWLYGEFPPAQQWSPPGIARRARLLRNPRPTQNPSSTAPTKMCKPQTRRSDRVKQTHGA